MIKQKGTIAQNSSKQHSIDCKDKNTPDEPEVVIDVSSPPDTVRHVSQWLEYAKGKRIKGGIFKEESQVTMDIWDFAGQHLYYASHPIFLSSRALYILVHNLSKPLNAPAEPCVRQGITDMRLENFYPTFFLIIYLITYFIYIIFIKRLFYHEPLAWESWGPLPTFLTLISNYWMRLSMIS